MARRKRALEVVRDDGKGSPPGATVSTSSSWPIRGSRSSVHCELKPGRFMTMPDLQQITGFGRTPVHHAVNRLSADTLIIIRPRHGLQIAPIDLARERMLLGLSPRHGALRDPPRRRSRQPLASQSGAAHRAAAA